MIYVNSQSMSTTPKRFNTARNARSSLSVRHHHVVVCHTRLFSLTFVFAVKEKYGSDADTDDLDADDSESDESEDEDGEELTPALDAAILRTLARIKAQDPGIYDTGRNVFEGATFIFTSFPSTHNSHIDRGARQVWSVVWPLSNEETQSA